MLIFPAMVPFNRYYYTHVVIIQYSLYVFDWANWTKQEQECRFGLFLFGGGSGGIFRFLSKLDLV